MIYLALPAMPAKKNYGLELIRNDQTSPDAGPLFA
jgi:hypothetical protein